jgi:cyclopropane-fatty-acyl-phospholipid synthase
MQWTFDLVERGWIPDPIVRRGIRRLLENRIQEINSDPGATAVLADQMRQSPLAIETDSANEQHYELPAQFFQTVLGSHLKYSCCYWPEGTTSLDEAEAAALELTCSRAEIEDGMEVLDLGCGWGSLTLWIAEHFPNCRVTAVSNSAPQGDFIRGRALALGLTNVEVLTADMNQLQLARTFDRIVSIEMFEHMRNYSLLLERVAGWLRPDGRLFVHVFCHRSRPYLFEDKGSSDWMARHFFTGGLMPSERLLEEFAGPVRLERRWRVNGRHYEKTSLAWLANMDRRKDEIRRLFESVYGPDAERWLHRWRMFFLACAELFGYRNGEEWFVSHSLWSVGETAVH